MRIWLTVALLSVALAISYIDRTNVAFALASRDFVHYFSLSDAQRGALNSAFFWTYGFLQIPAGALVDKYGPKWPIAVSLVVWCIAGAACGLAARPRPQPRADPGIARRRRPRPLRQPNAARRRGELAALPADFDHLPYANPAAPQGGRVIYGVLGTFDTLNPYSVRGVAAQGLTPPLGLVVQSLMMRSADEPFSLYGSIAETVDVPDDRSSITFHLNAKARFSDGHPVRAEDVLFSWGLLKEKGKPNIRSYYSKVVKAEVLDPLTIRFDLTGSNDRELPLILGLMPVLAQHATDAQRFEETSLAPLLGSGPYLVNEVKPGEMISYRRNPDFWGKDLPINRGLYNVDEYRFDYYRDANTLFEAFKGGLYDIRS